MRCVSYVDVDLTYPLDIDNIHSWITYTSENLWCVMKKTLFACEVPHDRFDSIRFMTSCVRIDLSHRMIPCTDKTTSSRGLPPKLRRLPFNESSNEGSKIMPDINQLTVGVQTTRGRCPSRPPLPEGVDTTGLSSEP